MWILIMALLGLGILTALLTLLHGKKGEEEPINIQNGSCETCNGENNQCEQECMMEASTRPVEYYDDEELDRFQGREADAYTDEEAEEFAEVLYTMRPEETKGWNRSLILRGINIPNQIKDELIALMGEQP